MENLYTIRDRQMRELVSLASPILSKKPTTYNVRYNIGTLAETAVPLAVAYVNGHMEVTDTDSKYTFDETMASYDTVFTIVECILKTNKVLD